MATAIEKAQQRLAADRSGARLFAGAAAVEIQIDDPVGLRLAGFDFNRKSAGQLDPLYARALFLSDGVRCLALACADVIGIANPLISQIAATVAGPLAESVIIAATHNHSAPDCLGYWGKSFFGLFPIRSGIEPEFFGRLQQSLIEAISDAAATARPARARFGDIYPDPRIVMNLRDRNLIDNKLSVAEFVGLDSEPISVMVNFAAHPETPYDKSRWITADYPGILCRELERRRGGSAIFFSSALGAMVTPNIAESAPVAERLEYMNFFGKHLAGQAEQALHNAVEPENTAIDSVSAKIELPVDNRLFRIASRLRVIDRQFGATGSSAQTVASIGPLRLATAPGEPSPEAGKMICKILGAEQTMLISIGLDELGYILPPEYFSDPNYRYEQSMSISPHALPILLESTERLIGELDRRSADRPLRSSRRR